MPWLTLTGDHLKAATSLTEYRALTSAQLANPGVAPTEEQLATVIGEIHGYLRTGGWPLGPATQIPATLKAAALDLLVYRMGARLNIPALLTDSRKDLYRDAIKKLEAIAARKLEPDAPDTTPTESSQPTGPTGPTFTTTRTRTQNFSRSAQDGA